MTVCCTLYVQCGSVVVWQCDVQYGSRYLAVVVWIYMLCGSALYDSSTYMYHAAINRPSFIFYHLMVHVHTCISFTQLVSLLFPLSNLLVNMFPSSIST